MAEPKCQCIVAGKVASDPDCPLAEEPVSWSGHEEIQTYLTARKGEMSDDFTCPCGHIGENCPALEDTAQRIRELEAENARLKEELRLTTAGGDEDARRGDELFADNTRLRATERRLLEALIEIAGLIEEDIGDADVCAAYKIADAAIAPEQDEPDCTGDDDCPKCMELRARYNHTASEPGDRRYGPPPSHLPLDPTDPCNLAPAEPREQEEPDGGLVAWSGVEECGCPPDLREKGLHMSRCEKLRGEDGKE